MSFLYNSKDNLYLCFRMEVVRGKKLVGNRGDFANTMVCSERVKFSHALPTDHSRRRRNSSVSTPKDPQNTVCKYWMSSRCIKGDSCRYLHSWSRGDGFTMLAKLEGHKKAVRGISLPPSSDKLYSGSSDGTFRIWDCNTGQCDRFTNLGDEVSSMFAAGPFVFTGMKNFVKALNIQTAEEIVLEAPVGQVNAMAAANTMLFAGTENGAITIWRGGPGSNPVQLAATMEGHTGAILSLAVGDNMLLSGSMDKTIRVWNTETLQCIETLNGHSDAVTSVIHCNGHLFSSSLDGTIKVWFATEGQNWEVIYTHNVEMGVLTMCGTNDAENKPVLLCSCNDNTVHLYELPTFTERGRFFSPREVKVIEIYPKDGLFFTGDATGTLTVWKWLQRG